MTTIKVPAGTNLDDVFELIKALASLPPSTDDAVVEAIKTLAEGSLAGDRNLLDLITAVIERVQALEAREEARHSQYVALVQRQADLVELATKAVNELEAMGKKYFAQTRKDVH